VPIPSVETIVARMARTRDENRRRMRPYTFTRTYNLYAKGNEKPKSEVIAEITFVPPGTRTYKVTHASGMRLGEKIVRQMLDTETQIVDQSDSNDISPANYKFQLLSSQEDNGRQFYVLELFPKRADKHLLHAKIWVDSTDFRLYRMSGEPAKSPSMWLRDSRITFSHGEVSGMWLQVASESIVNVRLFGEYRMVSRDTSFDVSKVSPSPGQ
jgi:hypothetical protein